MFSERLGHFGLLKNLPFILLVYIISMYHFNLISCSYMHAYIHALLGDPPDIDEGPFIPLPPVLPPGDMIVIVNSPAYIVDGFDLILVCRLVSGTRPITIMWLRDGEPYPTGGNNSRIAVSDYTNGEVFTCRADNIIGFDMENTTVIVFGK